MKQLTQEVEILNNNLKSKILYRNELQKQLDQIINSKFFSKWQKFTNLKKLFYINTYTNFAKIKIRKYK